MDEFWHDIESVPKGQWVLVTVAGMAAGFYEIAAMIDGWWVKKDNGSVVQLNMGPTHWAHIEEPPQYEEIA